VSQIPSNALFERPLFISRRFTHSERLYSAANRDGTGVIRPIAQGSNRNGLSAGSIVNNIYISFVTANGVTPSDNLIRLFISTPEETQTGQPVIWHLIWELEYSSLDLTAEGAIFGSQFKADRGATPVSMGLPFVLFAKEISAPEHTGSDVCDYYKDPFSEGYGLFLEPGQLLGVALGQAQSDPVNVIVSGGHIDSTEVDPVDDIVTLNDAPVLTPLRLLTGANSAYKTIDERAYYFLGVSPEAFLTVLSGTLVQADFALTGGEAYPAYAGDLGWLGSSPLTLKAGGGSDMVRKARPGRYRISLRATALSVVDLDVTINTADLTFYVGATEYIYSLIEVSDQTFTEEVIIYVDITEETDIGPFRIFLDMADIDPNLPNLGLELYLRLEILQMAAIR
jgi:hypothetical protein